MNDLYSVFTNITLKFPPCYFKTREKYLVCLMKTPETEDFNNVSDGGIFCLVLELIHETIHAQPVQSQAKPVIDANRMNNYFYWEKIQENRVVTVSKITTQIHHSQ